MILEHCHSASCTQITVESSLRRELVQCKEVITEQKAELAIQAEVIAAQGTQIDSDTANYCQVADDLRSQLCTQYSIISEQSALIEKLVAALDSKYIVYCGAWQHEHNEALAEYNKWKELK